MNIIYIQTAFLGDLLLSVPTLKQLRYVYPQSQLTLVCRKGFGEFFKNLGLVDEILEVDRKSKLQLAKELKDREFDLLLCPHQSYSSHRLVSKIRAQEKIGYKRWWNQKYFNQRVNRVLRWPEAIRQIQLIAPLEESFGVKLEAFRMKEDSIPPWAEMQLNQLSWSEAEVQKLVDRKISGLRIREPYICLSPGSVWATKRWSEKSFIKTAVELARSNFQIVILGAPEERQLCEVIQSNVPNSHSMAGHLGIFESIMLMSKSRGLLCNDSGAMHMASLLHLPCIALFGPTVVELGYKPWNPKALIIQDDSLLCRPCGQHGGNKCPIGTHRCMNDIPVKVVVETALRVFQ